MHKDNINIQLLEAKFRSGDEQAFKTLFEMYYARLSSYVNSYTNDSNLTQDIVQETFIKLWKAKDKIEVDKPIGGYLYKIAYNTFINNYRKNKQDSIVLDSLTNHKMIEILEQDNEDYELKEFRIKQIMKALESLPPRCKEIFKMSKLQGYKYKEIAETLNISIKTVEVQMGKALSFIRKEVRELKSFILFLLYFKK